MVVQLDRAFDVANPLEADDELKINKTTTTADVVQSLNISIQLFFNDWPPNIASAAETVKGSLTRIGHIPDDFWWAAQQLPADSIDNLPESLLEPLIYLVREMSILVSTMSNALFGSFGIDVSQDVLQRNKLNASYVKYGGFQVDVQFKTWQRYGLQFVSGYIATGCTLVLMAILTIIVRNTQWKRWPVVRLVIVILLAVGTASTATLWFANGYNGNNGNFLSNFLRSLWVMPALTLVWTIVLILTHINSDMLKMPLL